MRDQKNHTIAVSVTVRHTTPDHVAERTHEVVVTDGLTTQPEWRNRRIVAAVEVAVGLTLDDFGITDEQAELGRVGDFTTAPRADANVR